MVEGMRPLTAVAAVALLAGSLTGCGADPEPSPTWSPPAEPTTSQPAPPSEVPDLTAEPEPVPDPVPTDPQPTSEPGPTGGEPDGVFDEPDAEDAWDGALMDTLTMDELDAAITVAHEAVRILTTQSPEFDRDGQWATVAAPGVAAPPVLPADGVAEFRMVEVSNLEPAAEAVVVRAQVGINAWVPGQDFLAASIVWRVGVGPDGAGGWWVTSAELAS